MAWNENTPEYKDYVKYPRITGGAIGLWLHLDEYQSIQISHIARLEHGTLYMANGEMIRVEPDVVRLWRKVTTPTPEEAQQQHAQSLGLVRARVG